MEYLRESSRRNSAKVRGVSRRVFVEFLREIRGEEKNGLRERLRNFVRGVNAKKELFSWADL